MIFQEKIDFSFYRYVLLNCVNLPYFVLNEIQITSEVLI